MTACGCRLLLVQHQLFTSSVCIQGTKIIVCEYHLAGLDVMNVFFVPLFVEGTRFILTSGLACKHKPSLQPYILASTFETRAGQQDLPVQHGQCSWMVNIIYIECIHICSNLQHKLVYRPPTQFIVLIFISSISHPSKKTWNF